MTSLSECICKYHLSVKKIEKKAYCTVLRGEEVDYLWKKKSSSERNLFSYFESIGYSHYLSMLNHHTDSYELYYYFDDEIENPFQKAQKLIEVLSYLHLKSEYYEEISEVALQKFYEKIKIRIQDIQKYYEELQDSLECNSFPRIDYYYFMNQVSIFYRALFIANNLLEEWYQCKPTKIRKSCVVHIPFLNNFRMHEPYYFIDYHDCFCDYMINDFAFFYREDCLKVDMKSLFKQYDSVVSLADGEKKLLFCLICIPEKIEFSKQIYANTVKITREVEKVQKTLHFLLEEDKEDQKTNEEKFKE